MLEHVRSHEGDLRATLEKLLDLPIVGDVRGAGYFYGIELVKDKTTKETFDADDSERLLRDSCQGPVRRWTVLPRRRPRRPCHPGLAAVDLRPSTHFDEVESILARS